MGDGKKKINKNLSLTRSVLQRKRSTFYLVRIVRVLCVCFGFCLFFSHGTNVSKVATFFHYNGTFPPGYISTKTAFTCTKIKLKVYMKVGNTTWIEPKISFKGSS